MRRHRGKLQLVAIGLVVGALALAARSVDLEGWLEPVRVRIRGLGMWGPLAYILLFVLATLVWLPGTPFTVLAPILFGYGLGFVVMVAATTLSSVVAFLIARTAARDVLRRRLGRKPAFRRLERLVERDDWIVIPFLRLMPVPYAFNNYALGLTGISFWRYLLWSEVVMIPMNAVMVLGAGAIYRAVVRGETPWWLLGGTAGAGVVVAGAGWLARRRLGSSDDPPAARRGRV